MFARFLKTESGAHGYRIRLIALLLIACRFTFYVALTRLR